MTGVHDYSARATRSSSRWTPPRLDAVLRKLTEFGVRSLISQPPTLEQLFLRHYEVQA